MSIIKTSSQDIAAKIRDLAIEYGCAIEIRGSILTVTKRFTPGDKAAYCAAESEVGSVIRALPRSSAGSDWGTDGGSIGGMIGMQGGYMKLNRSGGNKRVLKELAA